MTEYVNPHPPHCPWHDFANDYGAPNLLWCEETLCAWISEPANTWSNMAFIIFGFLLWRYANKNNITPQVKVLAPLLIFLGLTSGLYHASNFYLTQLMDYVGMYAFIFWGLTLNCIRLKVITLKQRWIFFIGILILFMGITHLFYLWHIKYQLLIVVCVVLILISEFKLKKHHKISYKFLKLALFFVVIGEIFSLLDVKRVMCDPHNHFLQGHALWHLFSAIGLSISFFHWAQQKEIKP